MIEKVKGLIIKYREFIIYGICGVLTTAVDFGVYTLMTRAFDCGEVISQTTAVIAAIIFAFVTNKWIVFRSESSGGSLAAQFISFASMRAISGVFQTFALWLFSVKLGINDYAVKIAAAVIVVISNYIFSKLIIFRKK